MQIVYSPKLSADRFGADQDYFSKHIQGKALDVIDQTSRFFYVRDGQGEEWGVAKSECSIIDREPALIGDESGAGTAHA